MQNLKPFQIETGKKPMEELLKLIGSPVLVKLKNGMSYKGNLVKIDNYMNIYLQNAEEYDDNEKQIASYGDIIIRGNNILYVINPSLA
ncbi:MAG: ribonucleoprotein [Thaumarchaeota archaeon]|jgi:small nuclear ribonucleoprotein (snRNP)-like protein|nr:ribonucleoprotein [Nitrososphaerota archaeon]